MASRTAGPGTAGSWRVQGRALAFPSLAAVVGLASEARILKGSDVRVYIGGGTPSGAADAAERAVAEGAAALLSFGLAGGLDPDLPAGALVVPRFVRVGSESHEADAALVLALGGATQQVLLAGSEIVATEAAKRALWQRTGAAAVDLESGAVASVAVRNALPFAVVRAVCDPAGRDLPSAALIPLRPGGGIAWVRILFSVVLRPSQIAGLVALARQAAIARRTLQGQVGLFPRI